MTKGKELSFEGQTLYVGLDAHKTNWKINTRSKEMELTGFSQNPDAGLLAAHMRRNYPGATIKVVYEAGFCGFTIQRALRQLDIECLVVNAADVPATDKERKRKDDKRDARKLSRELAEGSLSALYVPDLPMEHARTLVRGRHRLAVDLSRCKNRIKHLLLFSGLKPTAEPQRWSARYVKDLESLACATPALRAALDLALEEYKQIKGVLKQATEQVGQLSGQEPFASVQPYLLTIDGVGLVNAMVIQTELQDIRRFKTLDSLCDYCGLVPDLYSSNDCQVVKGITRRCNEFLREALIESAWMLIRYDPAMLMKYNTYRSRMNKNKAIIRIAKHLLARIRYVWQHQSAYQRGVVGEGA